MGRQLKQGSLLRNLYKHKGLLTMAIPGFVMMVMFSYMPMVGLLAAFKNFDYTQGLFGSDWCGLQNFQLLLESKDTTIRIVRNTVLYWCLLTGVGTVMNVTIAILIYECTSNRFGKYSHTNIHRITVPKQELDVAGAYTVCERLIIERKPYFTETEDVKETIFPFHPVKPDGVRTFQLADTHGNTKVPLLAAKAFGAIDFLILNGDIINHSGSVENFDAFFEIAETLTGGNIPIVFSRGNHDLRGVSAEKLADYTPTDHGNSYYTFQLGSIWGILLDCGEDKADDHPEYGNTICCHAFREGETEYLKQVIQNSEKEYMAEGVSYKLVLSHIPFPHKRKEPFGIDGDIYTEWCRLLKEYVKPDMILSGHKHDFFCG